jgi:hypothetical protein
MKAFWHRIKASWLKSWAPEGRRGQMEMKCISYFYMGQGYSGERCGQWTLFICVTSCEFALVIHMGKIPQIYTYNMKQSSLFCQRLPRRGTSFSLSLSLLMFNVIF